MPELSRRGLLTGLIAFAATAPSIVRAASIMPVSAKNLILPPPRRLLIARIVVDKLLNMPVELWASEETWTKIHANEHERYVTAHWHSMISAINALREYGDLPEVRTEAHIFPATIADGDVFCVTAEP